MLGAQGGLLCNEKCSKPTLSLLSWKKSPQFRNNVLYFSLSIKDMNVLVRLVRYLYFQCHFVIFVRVASDNRRLPATNGSPDFNTDKRIYNCAPFRKVVYDILPFGPMSLFAGSSVFFGRWTCFDKKNIVP